MKDTYLMEFAMFTVDGWCVIVTWMVGAGAEESV
jgi:hypothetical protein